MSDQEQKVKVSDRRMFTPDGELREEYRFLEERQAEEQEPASEELASEELASEEPAREEPAREEPAIEGTHVPPSETPKAGAPMPEDPMREVAAQGDQELSFGQQPPQAPSPESFGASPGPEMAAGAQAPQAGAAAGAEGPPLELPSNAGQPGAPGLMDLVAMLAEPASIYLGDAPLPDGRTHEDLELARVHIDLLDVLRQKTAGNLSARESAVLEDVLYQLKMRYVRKQG